MLPDEPAIDKTFDYALPDHLAADVRVGTIVRVPLHGRRVRGWVVATDVEPPPGVALQPVAKVTGIGPPPAVLDLARWAAWRWAGRTAHLLRTASPPRVVGRLPPRPQRPDQPTQDDPVAAAALTRERSVLRLPPAGDPTPVVSAMCRRGAALVLVPSLANAAALGRRLRAEGVPVAVTERDWPLAAAGAAMVGTRAAAWAPIRELAGVVVLDEHDEAHAEERAPTWNAREVGIERARRAGVPCVLVSPTPSLEALAWGELLTVSRSEERAGWPIVDVIDRRRDDVGRTGLYSEALVRRLRDQGRVVCVLNRRGRARLLACAGCGELARCTRCGAAVGMPEEGTLVCARCDEQRPLACEACGRTRMKNLRVGVGRAREELEALLREPVVEVTGSTATDQPLPEARVYVGTEAVLHRVREASVVAFLDLDQELLSPRYRAAEQAFSLVVRAARLLGGRRGGGRLVLQTRLPHHEVVLAALHADPARLADAERERRRALGFPPFAALAEISGASAEAFVAALGAPAGVEVLGPSEGRWLLRAPDHRILCDALAATPRPSGRVRVAVDPPRV